MGRPVAWFEDELQATTVQFANEPAKPARKKRKRRCTH
jgi:hypothetical protein